MKHFMVLCVCALLLPPLTSRAGLEEGTAAYAAGDYAKALTEFRALAEQGNMEGQYFLGFMYHNGFGVKRDQAEAIKWFQKSAEQGDARAQYYVGIMYGAGHGVAKDLKLADMWLTLSASNPRSSYRDSLYTREEIKRVERKMTPEQIAEAKDLAKNWKPPQN